MQTVKKILMACALIVCHGSIAEVWKCLDEAGNATYQGTSCDSPGDEARLDLRFSNTLSLGIPESDAAALWLRSQKNARLRQVRIRDQKDRIAARIHTMEQKQALCASLKSQLDDLQVSRRRYGRGDPHVVSDLVARMREACSS